MRMSTKSVQGNLLPSFLPLEVLARVCKQQQYIDSTLKVTFKSIVIQPKTKREKREKEPGKREQKGKRQN
jgi:hypothetical protein